MAPRKPMYNHAGPANLHQEILAAVLHKALEHDPELLNMIYDDSGNVDDSAIHSALKSHNDSRLQELRGQSGSQKSASLQQDGDEPVSVRVASPKKRFFSDGANQAVNKIDEELRRKRGQK